MDELHFKQMLALKLAGNPEFIKQVKADYDGKYIWHCVSEQINETVRLVKIPEPPKE